MSVVILFLIVNSSELRRVKIAIYANSEKNPTNSFIYTNNVLYLNSLGADVVAVFAWDSIQYLDYVISNVDGFYFQGGDVDISSDTMFYRTYNYILSTIKDLNDRNIKKVAMWHTCLGFEMFVNSINKSNALESFDSVNEVSDLVFEDSEIKNSKMYANLSDNILKAMKENKIINENHKFGFSRKTFENPNLKDFFIITSYSFDQKKKEYVASIEAKNYPFFGVQYHPEKTAYQRREADKVSNSFEAIQFTKQIGFNFINYARKSYDKTFFSFSKIEEINYKNYCYLKVYKTVVITDQDIFNKYFSLVLANEKEEYSKFSLRNIEINKFEYKITEDGSTKIFYYK